MSTVDKASATHAAGSPMSASFEPSEIQRERSLRDATRIARIVPVTSAGTT